MTTTHNHSLDLQPQGAYTQLDQLQRLRHVAAPLVSFNQRRQSGLSSGQHRSRSLSRGMEFAEVRIYQAGDDVRNIDWRVTARTQVTHTKRYQDEKEKPVVTLVDQRRSLFFGSAHCFKSVYACHLAALINWATLKRGDRVGGIVVGADSMGETRPARSHKTVNRWLQQLHSFNGQLRQGHPKPEISLAQALQQLRQVAKSGYECIIISDFYDLDSQCEAHLFDLARRHSVNLCWVVDPLEIHLPLMPNLTISNGRDKATLSIHRRQQEHHQHQHQQKQHHIESLCQSMRLGFYPMNSSQTLTDNIASLIAKRR